MKERICCVCRKKDLANTKIRVARVRVGKDTFHYFVDNIGNANGRGAYLCRGCIEQCIKKRQLNRSFRGNVPQNIYDELAKLKH